MRPGGRKKELSHEAAKETLLRESCRDLSILSDQIEPHSTDKHQGVQGGEVPVPAAVKSFPGPIGLVRVAPVLRDMLVDRLGDHAHC